MNPAVKDKRVRQAISYAIDRQDVVEAIYYGYSTLTDQPIAPSIMGSRKGPLKYPYKSDLEKAKQLLKEAGYPNGFEITCITSSKPWLRRETELMAAQLARVGIRVKIDALDMSTFDTRRVKEKRFEMLLEDISNPSADPDSTIYWFHHTGTAAYFGPPDKPFNLELENLLDKGRAVTDPQKRLPIYHAAVDKILEDAVYIYICHVDWITAAHKYVKNYVQPPTSKKMFGEVWLDK
jgi:peptide/nickel transport system substrate-binding protein